MLEVNINKQKIIHFSFLFQEEELKGIPLMVLANKQVYFKIINGINNKFKDLLNAMTEAEV